MIAFARALKTFVKGEMIKYLFAKSFCDSCYCTINVLFCLPNIYPLKYSYYYQVFNLCTNLYLKHVAIFLSIVFACSAIVEGYRLTTERIKWVHKITKFNRGMPFLTFTGLCLYSYKFIEFRIILFEPYGINSSNILPVSLNFTTEGGGLSNDMYLTLEMIQATIVNCICISFSIHCFNSN